MGLRKVNVLEMSCLGAIRSQLVVDRMRNEDSRTGYSLKYKLGKMMDHEIKWTHGENTGREAGELNL